MRFKVGDTWIEAKPGTPLLVEFNPEDKNNISMMHTANMVYPEYHEDEPMTEAERRAWERAAE